MSVTNQLTHHLLEFDVTILLKIEWIYSCWLEYLIHPTFDAYDGKWHNMHNMQNMQTIQNMQNMQNLQNMQNMQNV